MKFIREFAPSLWILFAGISLILGKTSSMIFAGIMIIFSVLDLLLIELRKINKSHSIK